jgi:hypothetical protein
MKNLRNKINDAEGYLVVTPEYNRGPIRLDKCLHCDDRQYHHTDQQGYNFVKNVIIIVLNLIPKDLFYRLSLKGVTEWHSLNGHTSS